MMLTVGDIIKVSTSNGNLALKIVVFEIGIAEIDKCDELYLIRNSSKILGNLKITLRTFSSICTIRKMAPAVAQEFHKAFNMDYQTANSI
jgi:lipoprotein-releasing system permease protein